MFDLSPFVSQDPDLGGYVQFSVSVAHPDPHQIERKDPDPHQSDKLYPDPHQFADDKPQCIEYEPIRAFFKVLSLYLEARIQIWIHTKVITER